MGLHRFNHRPLVSTLLAAAVAAALSLLASGPARAETLAAKPQTATDTANAALRFLGRLNHPDILEGAGSHGSLGLSAGAGAESLATPEANSILRAQLGDAAGGTTGSEATTGNYTLARAWLVKGLPIPVDLGLTAGRPVDNAASNLTQVSAHVQWTVFEALAMPALALRGSVGRIFGLADTTLTSVAGSAVVSYGFLKIVTLFGEVGAIHHEGELVQRPGGATSLGLSAAVSDSIGSDGRLTQTWVETVRTAGVSIALLPPFVTVTGAVQDSAEGSRSYAAKLSIGL